MPLPVLLQDAASICVKPWVNSAERPPVTQVRLVELPLHFVGTEISPSPAHSLFQVTADLPIWGHGDVSLPSSEFTSTSLSPNEGQTVGRTLEGTSLVGLALLITKTDTSCCPRAYREDHGSCVLEKNEKGAAKKPSCKATALC